jgi:hypothetical protein
MEPPGVERIYKDPPHSANFGDGLAEQLKSVGVDYELNYTGASGVKHPDLFGFLLDKLNVDAGR